MRVFGAAAFWGPQYATGVIPARLFFALWTHLPALEAGERLEAAEAGRLAQCLAEDPKNPRVRSEAKRLSRLALPLIYPELPPTDEATRDR